MVRQRIPSNMRRGPRQAPPRYSACRSCRHLTTAGTTVVSYAIDATPHVAAISFDLAAAVASFVYAPVTSAVATLLAAL